MKNETKKIVLFVVFLLGIALVAVALFAIDGILGLSDSDEPIPSSPIGDIEKDMNTVYIDGEAYYRKKNVVNYLIMGIDSFGEVGDGGVGQADFIMVLSFDVSNKTYTMIPVNRDTMTEIEIFDVFDNSMGKRVEQIALSHAYGSSMELSNVRKCQSTASAVGALLYGVKFEECVSMTMDAVCKTVDTLGGVELVMEEDWTEIDPSYTKGAKITLDGQAALGFIRARGALTDSSNIARMRRQEQFLNAFIQRLSVLAMNDEELMEAYDKVAPYLVTSSGADPLIEIADKVSVYKSNGTVSLPGEAKVGEKYMEFYVDDERLKDVVKELFFDRYDD